MIQSLEFALLGITSLLLGPSSIATNAFVLAPVSPKHASPAATTTIMEEEITGKAVIQIQYCKECRWMLKAFWYAQEILTTFEREESLTAIVLAPFAADDKEVHKGDFIVSLFLEKEKNILLWDRKAHQGFPEPKDLKQLLRDELAPALFLGHSDTQERQQEQEEPEAADTKKNFEVLPTTKDANPPPAYIKLRLPVQVAPQPAVTITYCTGCRWLLRAAYFGQELLTTFGQGEIASVVLVPSRPPFKGGQYTVECDGKLLFDRAALGGFPSVKQVKQTIRDLIAPEKDLGHSDDDDNDGVVKEMDDDDAEQARKYFGVS